MSDNPTVKPPMLNGSAAGLDVDRLLFGRDATTSGPGGFDMGFFDDGSGSETENEELSSATPAPSAPVPSAADSGATEAEESRSVPPRRPVSVAAGEASANEASPPKKVRLSLENALSAAMQKQYELELCRSEDGRRAVEQQ